MPVSGRLAKKYLELQCSIELDRTTHFPHHRQESPLWVNNRCCPVPSTGWEQDAQFLSSHGGCLSTAVVRYQCSRVKVPVHTGVVQSWVILGVLFFRCEGTSIWVSWCRPGRFPFTPPPSPPLFEEISTVPQRGSGRCHFQWCIMVHTFLGQRKHSHRFHLPRAVQRLCAVFGVLCVARQAGHIGDSSWTAPLTVLAQRTAGCARSSTAWWSFQLCAADNVFSRFISAHSRGAGVLLLDSTGGAY